MKTIFIHGVGEKPAIWDVTLKYMVEKDVLCPNLFEFPVEKLDYANVYKAFCEYCQDIDGELNLCGIAFGAIIALNYAIDHPEKTKSLVLISAQYKLDEKQLKMQNMMYKLMPKKLLEGLGVSKEECMALNMSLAGLDFTSRLCEVKCPTLIISGNKDGAGKKVAQDMEAAIKDAKLEMISGSSHQAYIYDYYILGEMIDRFYGNEREEDEADI